jgi:hypothetical protein
VASDLTVAANIVMRFAVAAVLVWVITRLVSRPDALHIVGSVLVGAVALSTLFWAVVGVKLLLSRSRT